MKDQGTTNRRDIKQLKKMKQLVAELTSWKNEHETIADELKQSEMKFRKLSEKSVVGIYLIQDGLLKYVNPKFADTFGYKVDEIINRLEVKKIIFPEDWSLCTYISLLSKVPLIYHLKAIDAGIFQLIYTSVAEMYLYAKT